MTAHPSPPGVSSGQCVHGTTTCADASKKRERKGKTLDEWEREEGGPVQEAQVAMAHTQRAVRRKEGTALTGDTRLLEVEDLEKAEQELTVAEDDGIKLEPFNLKVGRKRLVGEVLSYGQHFFSLWRHVV